MSFTIGDRVGWTSSAAGKTSRKEGEVVDVVAPGDTPPRKGLRDPGAPRDHESYIVQVGSKRYWPRVDGLQRLAPAVIEEKPEAKLAKVGALLRALVDEGFHLYVDGGNNLHLMTSPSHDEDGSPLKQNIIASEHVPGLGGGDW